MHLLHNVTPLCFCSDLTPAWWMKMIPVLICALITLSAADNDLDTLYPDLVHSRTIYITGEYLLCVLFWCRDDVTQNFVDWRKELLQCFSLRFVHNTHSAVSFVSSDYQFVLLLLWLSDNAAMWGLLALRDTAISSALVDEYFVWTRFKTLKEQQTYCELLSASTHHY